MNYKIENSYICTFNLQSESSTLQMLTEDNTRQLVIVSAYKFKNNDPCYTVVLDLSLTFKERGEHPDFSLGMEYVGRVLLPESLSAAAKNDILFDEVPRRLYEEMRVVVATMLKASTYNCFLLGDYDDVSCVDDTSPVYIELHPEDGDEVNNDNSDKGDEFEKLLEEFIGNQLKELDDGHDDDDFDDDDFDDDDDDDDEESENEPDKVVCSILRNMKQDGMTIDEIENGTTIGEYFENSVLNRFVFRLMSYVPYATPDVAEPRTFTWEILYKLLVVADADVELIPTEGLPELQYRDPVFHEIKRVSELTHAEVSALIMVLGERIFRRCADECDALYLTTTCPPMGDDNRLIPKSEYEDMFCILSHEADLFVNDMYKYIAFSHEQTFPFRLWSE